MDTFSMVGYIAAIFTTTGFLPQVYKIFKTKSTKDISLTMYLVLAIGTILWLAYGILINALPVIVANSVSLTLISSVLLLKLKFK